MNIWEWVFKVKDESSKPLNGIRDSFENLENAANATVQTFKNDLKSNQLSVARFAESSKKIFGKTAKTVKGFVSNTTGSMQGWLQGFASHGKQIGQIGTHAIGDALKYVIKVFTSHFKSLWSTAADLADIYLGVGKHVRTGSKDYKEAISLFGELEFGIGLSTEAAKEMVNLGQKWQMSGKQLSTWAKAASEVALASGTSATEMGSLFIQMMKFRNIPVTRLRSVAAAMLDISDKTGITMDQLVSFNKGLSEFFLRIPSQSKKSGEALTVNLSKLAGEFASVLGDPTKFTDMLSKMANPYSAEGHAIASEIGRISGLTGRAVLYGIQDAPKEVFDAFAKSLATMDYSQFQRQALVLQSTMGLGYEDLAKLRMMGKKHLGMTLTDQEKAMEKESELRRRRQRMVNWERKALDSWRRSMLEFWASIGKPVVLFMKEVMKPLGRSIRNIAQIFVQKLGNGSDAGKSIESLGKKIGEWLGGVLNDFAVWLSTNWEGKIVPVLKKVGNVFDKLIGALEWLWEKVPWKWIGDNIGTIAIAFAGWKIASGLMGSLGAIPALLAAIGTAAVAAGNAIAGIELQTDKERERHLKNKMEEFNRSLQFHKKKGETYFLSQALSAAKETSTKGEAALKKWAELTETFYMPSKKEEWIRTRGKPSIALAKMIAEARERVIAATTYGEESVAKGIMEAYAAQLEAATKGRRIGIQHQFMKYEGLFSLPKKGAITIPSMLPMGMAELPESKSAEAMVNNLGQLVNESKEQKDLAKDTNKLMQEFVNTVKERKAVTGSGSYVDVMLGAGAVK